MKKTLELHSGCQRLSKKIGVVSTGGPLSLEREKLGLHNLATLGFDSLREYPASEYYGNYEFGFANGSPAQRIDAIKKLLNNPEVSCLLSARGASGSLEIINQMPYAELEKQKKTLIGESDVTSLLIQLPARCGIPAIHGSTLGASIADYNNFSAAKESVDVLIKMLTDETYRQVYDSQAVLKMGDEEEGRLLAGNLTMLVSLLGTEFDVNYSDSILIIEEVGEAPYRVQRMLDQLYLAGKFEKLKGFCLARFSKCEAKAGPSIDMVIKNFCDSRLKNKTYPILSGLEIGHWGKNLPVPLGCKAIIKGQSLFQLQSPLM